MLFPTFAFFVFYLTAWGVYWLLRRNGLRLSWLLLASAVFYAQWNPWFLSLILFTAGFDYVVALRLPALAPRPKKALLALSLTVNLSLLCLFKYAGFLVASAASVLSLCGSSVRVRVPSLILPLGISFYTFETISYVVDVYRGRLAPVRSVRDYALFILFFPHLIAGPIVRAAEFLPQLPRGKPESWARFELGLRLFLVGLFKKVLADRLAAVVDPVFAHPGSYGSAAVWLALLGYSAQIYADFSGYTDMALGLAHTFGLKLPQNFRSPYLSSSIAEFWRRWHITLSRWLRDYLYIPLGGSRRGSGRTVLNLLGTMLLAGLWHGAGWSFVLWGLYHGLLLAGHRLLFRDSPPARGLARVPGAVVTFFSVTLGWALFRSPALSGAGVLLSRALVPTAGATLAAGAGAVAIGGLLLVLAGQLWSAFPRSRELPALLPAPLRGAALAVLLVLTQLLIPDSGKAFIYFRF